MRLMYHLLRLQSLFAHTMFSSHRVYDYVLMLVRTPLCMCTSRIHCVNEPLPFLIIEYTQTHNTFALLHIWPNITLLSSNDGTPTCIWVKGLYFWTLRWYFSYSTRDHWFHSQFYSGWTSVFLCYHCMFCYCCKCMTTLYVGKRTCCFLLLCTYIAHLHDIYMWQRMTLCNMLAHHS